MARLNFISRAALGILFLISIAVPSTATTLLPLTSHSNTFFHFELTVTDGEFPRQQVLSGSAPFEPTGEMNLNPLLLSAEMDFFLNSNALPLTFSTTIGPSNTPLELAFDTLTFEVPEPARDSIETLYGATGSPASNGKIEAHAFQMSGSLAVGGVTAPFSFPGTVT